MTACLSGIRVLDLSRILAGPWATQLLSDLGAEVIKVERLKGGDETRAAGPPFLRDSDGKETTDAAFYLSANRGKKSLALDISSPAGQEIVRKLAAKSDVLVENFMVGKLASYGLGYEDLRAINPGLIYCSITGFGQTGPYRERPGYDFVAQAMGGMMSITGERGRAPVKTGIAMADLMTGMYSTVAILAALAHRGKTGVGQHIDMALLDVQVAAMANMHMNYLVGAKIPERYGNAHANLVPYQEFKCRDGHIIVTVGSDSLFRKLCLCLEVPELADDERFATNPARVRNRETLIPLLAAVFAERDMVAWLERLEQVSVPCAPINNIAQVFDDPQVQHRGLRFDMSHPLAGTVPQVANPIRFSETPIAPVLPPPLLGEHTSEILKEVLGLDETAIERLAADRVIRQ
jgi:crotonobetainyl-CoA:carnitine CoA-transferase CaiB-like acyl-CoA transferase